MSYVIALNDNEFVKIYRQTFSKPGENEIKEVQYVTISVNLDDATIFEDYKETENVIKEIINRLKYINFYSWKDVKDNSLKKEVKNFHIRVVSTAKIDENVDTIIALTNKYENKLVGYETFKERYNVLFRSANPENPFETLPQYALDRDVFTKIYGNVSDVLMNESRYETSDFKGWYNDDEWYILHKPSGTMVNWYKHCGRTNTCNKVLTLEQHKEFAKMILEDMAENNVGGYV